MHNADCERMSSIDHAWLRMDRPYNYMTINGVMILEDRLDLPRLLDMMEHRFLRVHRRFRQRPVETAAGAFWETDTHFELTSHVRRVGLPGAGGKVELEEFVSNLVSTPMDPTKPLWDFHLIEDYQGGSAVIGRIHHCYADGIAMIYVLLSMTTTTPDVPIEQAQVTPSVAHKDGEDGGGDIFRRLFHPVTAAVASAVKAGRDLFETVEGGVEEIVLHPAETLGYARQGLGLAAEAGKLLLLPDDPKTRLRGKQGVAKRVAWAEPLPLTEVKAVSKALGCTINDVLLSCAAGALRDYLVAKGDTVEPGLEIRATVPVNLRPLEQANRLGNVFGLVLLTLPIGIENPLERLFELKKRMEELKGSYQAILALGLLGVLGLGPSAIQASAIRTLTRKATAVMTNVPGPQFPLYWAGAKLSEMMFWVPQTGSIGMGISILSYNNRVHFGLVTDFKIVRDPEAIINRFGAEFEKLLLLTMLGPWDRQLDPQLMKDTVIALRQPLIDKPVSKRL